MKRQIRRIINTRGGVDYTGSELNPRGKSLDRLSQAEQQALVNEADNALNWLLEQAREGDTEARTQLEYWLEESWNTIHKRTEIEGSAWVVWWNDGISKYARENYKGKTRAVPTLNPRGREVIVTIYGRIVPTGKRKKISEDDVLNIIENIKNTYKYPEGNSLGLVVMNIEQEGWQDSDMAVTVYGRVVSSDIENSIQKIKDTYRYPGNNEFGWIINDIESEEPTDVSRLNPRGTSNMALAIAATNKHFESSASQTPEYLAWHRLFKREFTKFLQERGMTDIEIGRPNHFDMSGFFRAGRQLYYFSISDLRWSKDTMLIRTAAHNKDWSGGSNMFCPLSNTAIHATDAAVLFAKCFAKIASIGDKNADMPRYPEACRDCEDDERQIHRMEYEQNPRGAKPSIATIKSRARALEKQYEASVASRGVRENGGVPYVAKLEEFVGSVYDYDWEDRQIIEQVVRDLDHFTSTYSGPGYNYIGPRKATMFDRNPRGYSRNPEEFIPQKNRGGETDCDVCGGPIPYGEDYWAHIDEDREFPLHEIVCEKCYNKGKWSKRRKTARNPRAPISATELEHELNNFMGAEHYYWSSIFKRLKLTDGMQYLCKTAGAFWLADIVESVQPKFKNVEFQLWRIRVADDQSFVVDMREDTNTPVLYKQEGNYTDFPLREFEFYCIDKVALLKSEY